MSTAETIERPPVARALHAEWPAYAALGAGIALWLLVFRREAWDAVTQWQDSTAYNHAFLILPIAAYLIWDRRGELSDFTPRPAPLCALLALPVAAAWFAADRIGFMEGRQLVAVTGLEVLFLSVLGGRSYWRISGPLLYLYFLVPFGGWLTPSLQHITTVFVMHGLDLLGVPNFTDGVTIQIPEGTFIIAEACAGLRFLIAAVAFSCLYALMIYRSPWRRAIFIGVSLFVPVIANGFRALGIVYLGHLLGSAQAAETDHILYGWIFFSIVLLILIVLGLPFREDYRRPGGGAAAVPPVAPMQPQLAGAAVAATILLLFLGPATAQAFDALAPKAPDTIHFAADAPCAFALAQESARGGSVRSADYTCAGQPLVLRAVTFGPRTPARAIVKAQEEMGQLANGDAAHGHLRGSGLDWSTTTDIDPPTLAAALIWSNGHVVAPGLRFRLRRAWDSIAGGGAPVVVLAVAPAHMGEKADQIRFAQQEQAMRTFAETQTWLPRALAAFSSARR
jgi:exosortase A